MDPRSGPLDPGIQGPGALDPGTWTLAPGPLHCALGPWSLVPGSGTQGPGHLGTRAPGYQETWILDPGSWSSLPESFYIQKWVGGMSRRLWNFVYMLLLCFSFVDGCLLLSDVVSDFVYVCCFVYVNACSVLCFDLCLLLFAVGSVLFCCVLSVCLDCVVLLFCF